MLLFLFFSIFAWSSPISSFTVTEKGRHVQLQWKYEEFQFPVYFVIFRQNTQEKDPPHEEWKIIQKYMLDTKDSFLDTTTEMDGTYQYQIGIIKYSKFAQHNTDIAKDILFRSPSVSLQRSTSSTFFYTCLEIIQRSWLYIGCIALILLYIRIISYLRNKKTNMTSPIRISIILFCCLPIFAYLSQNLLIGGWSLPYALLRPWFAWLCVLIALSLHILKPQHICFGLGILNAAIAMQDFSIRFPSNQGISILSWNVGTPKIGTKDRQSLQCVLESIQNWEQEYQNQNNSILFLQEIEKNSAQFFEEEQKHRTCSWQPYSKNCNKWSCNGSMICLPDDWSFAKTHHRTLRSDNTKNYRRGALQTEIISPQKQVINVFNLHLQSLYESGVELNYIKDGGNFRHGRFFIEHPIQTWRSFSHMLDRQNEEVDALYRVFSDLNDPILLIGDFNSVSTLPIHYRLRHDFSSKTKGTAPKLVDAHRQTGIGYGFTAIRSGIPARVDFLYAQSPLEWTGKTRVRRDFENCSDHWAIESWLDLKDP